MQGISAFVCRRQPTSRANADGTSARKRGGRPDVFVQRITLFVMMATTVEPFTYGKLFSSSSERGPDQTRPAVLQDAALGYISIIAASRGGNLHVQMNRIACVGQATLGVFFPVVGKLADFHIDHCAPAPGGQGNVRQMPATSRCTAYLETSFYAKGLKALRRLACKNRSGAALLRFLVDRIFRWRTGDDRY